ncbi:MAG: hypothetical protein ACRDV9_15455 [Acidimicrobiia bacterium]
MRRARGDLEEYVEGDRLPIANGWAGLMIKQEQVSAAVTVVRFDHGPMSLLDLEFLVALRAELTALDEGDTALVLTGTGSTFSGQAGDRQADESRTNLSTSEAPMRRPAPSCSSAW